jgi:hypothetical protein
VGRVFLRWGMSYLDKSALDEEKGVAGSAAPAKAAPKATPKVGPVGTSSPSYHTTQLAATKGQSCSTKNSWG